MPARVAASSAIVPAAMIAPAASPTATAPAWPDLGERDQRRLDRIHSDGIFEQSFPARLVIPLTDDERREYGIGTDVEAHRIDSEDGFILFWIEDGSCRVTTGDGDPNLIREMFLARLPDENAKVDADLSREHEPHGVVARMPLSPTQFILIHFLAGENAGFYGSARSYSRRP